MYLEEKKFLDYAIDNELDLQFNSYYSLYYHCLKDESLIDHDIYVSNIAECIDFFNFIKELSNQWLLDCYSILFRYRNSSFGKYKRVMDRVQNIFDSCTDDYKLVFLTFTFNDNHYRIVNSNSDFNEDFVKYQLKTRKHLSYVLRKYSKLFIANEDFGALNERFHYHAICLVPVNMQVADTLTRSWGYGYTYSEDINRKNVLAMSTYITKLVSHSVKITNKRRCLMYSKLSRFS